MTHWNKKTILLYFQITIIVNEIIIMLFLNVLMALELGKMNERDSATSQIIKCFKGHFYDFCEDQMKYFLKLIAIK